MVVLIAGGGGSHVRVIEHDTQQPRTNRSEHLHRTLRGVATGVSFTDQNAQFFAFDVLTVISGMAAAFLVALAGLEAGWRVRRGSAPGLAASRLDSVALLLLGLTIAAGLGLLVGGARPKELLHFVYAVVAIGADLRVSIYDAAAADQGNRAYAALRAHPPGRLLELPVYHPSVQLGSVYPYYDQEAERQRPGGYSTVTDFARFRGWSTSHPRRTPI